MKVRRVALILLLAIAVSVIAPLGAGALAFSYSTGFQVQNLSTSTASISIVFYNPDGTVANTVADSIAGSGSKTYFPLTAVTDGFDGSVVIQSGQQVAAVVNVLGSGAAPAAASYVGAMQGSPTLMLPLLMKNNSGYNTWFKVQNAGSTTTTVNVAYSDGTTATASVAPGASAMFNQATETHSLAVFSAIVTNTGNQPLAAAVIEESTTVMFAYSGFTGGSTNPVMPLINANNAGYITGVQIQNAGSAATDVTVTYTPSLAGTVQTETQSIPAGGSRTFALGLFAANQQRFVGSARVTTNTASQPLVAIVNQLRPGANGEAYGGFDPAQATNTVVMPLIMDRNSGYYTGFSVMNVGSAAATVNCTFTGTAYTVSDTLAPGEAMTALQNNQIAAGYVGSGTCTAGAGSQIVAVVNELGSGAGDQFLVYEGIPAS